MANALFNGYKAQVLGDVATAPGHTIPAWEADTIKVWLVDHSSDTPSTTADYDLADIGAGARIGGTAQTIGSVAVTIATNTFTVDGGDVTFSAVSGASAESIVIYRDSGVESTSLLLVFFDTATGLPVTPNGGDITISWNASGIWTW